MKRIGGVAIGLALIAASACAGETSARTRIGRYSQGGWSLGIAHDGFAQRTHCTLAAKSKSLLFQPRAVGFRFGSHADTLHAIYRVDDGAPQRWSDRYPALIAAGARIDGAGLDTPTDGIVWLPVDEVLPARSVSIRLDPDRRVRAFALRGFAPMLAAAHRLGCTDDASFAS